MSHLEQAVAALAVGAVISTAVAVPASSASATSHSVTLQGVRSATASTAGKRDLPPFPKISYGWNIYWRWNTAKVIRVAQFSTVFISGMLSTTCAALPNKYAIAACVGAVNSIGWSVTKTFEAAGREGKCVEIRLNHVGIPYSWKRYSC